MSIDHFQPAKDYDSLRKQAFALYSLLQAQQDELTLLRKQRDLASRFDEYQALLDSEREANAKLTERVLELEAALERASGADDNDLVIECDQDDYPSERTLDAITTFRGSPEQLLEAVRPLFEPYGRCEQKGNIWSVATGGWSGCESVIRAMLENRLFWGMAWYQSKRGGYYEFHLPDQG